MNCKRISFGLLLAVITVLLLAMPGECISAKKILKKVEDTYEDLKDFRAGFSQTMFIDSTDSGYTVMGNLCVKKPDKFRLELEHQTMVSDGDTLWTYVPGNQQVLVDQADTTGEVTRPDQLFLKYFKEAEAELVGEEKLNGHGCYLLHLKPKKSEAISSLRVWVDQKTWLARRLEVTDTSGMITYYLFTDVQINPELADSMFVFQAPPDVEIIDLRW